MGSEEELVKEVGSKYAKLNELWGKAEESLKKFLVPHEVEYRYTSFVDESDKYHVQNNIQTHRCLSWAKHSGNWRLCYTVYSDGSDERYVKPVAECAVDIRLKLVVYFPVLRCRVVAASRSTIISIHKAVEELSGYLEDA